LLLLLFVTVIIVTYTYSVTRTICQFIRIGGE